MTKIHYCDNCGKKTNWDKGAFQCGVNKKRKIGTWCNDKCFQKGTKPLKKKICINLPPINSKISGEKNRVIILSPEEAFLLWNSACKLNSNIRSVLKGRLYRLITNNERTKLKLMTKV